MQLPLIHQTIVRILVVLPAVFLGGCVLTTPPSSPPEEFSLIKVEPSVYPVFVDDIDFDGLAFSIQKSLSYLNTVPSHIHFSFGPDRFSREHMIKSLEHFLDFIFTKPLPRDINSFIRRNYLVYRSIGTDPSGRVLFTGYYEPFLQGHSKKNDEYRFPIYARPEDLITIGLSPFSSQLKGKTIIGRCIDNSVLPYFDREAIDYEGSLQGKAEILAWVRDEIDLFFLHIQGSGKIFLGQNNSINVHYHTSNGRPYRSIGKLLIDEGKIPRDQMSMQKIREYLRNHPNEIKTILTYNPSYVFFKIEEDGPLGALEVKLTPGRSLALDRRIFPPSALAFIHSKLPLTDGDGRIHKWVDLHRFVLNQDTGGAIKGPGRADLFWGNGPYAEIAAGHMQHTGKLYFLVLKPDSS